MKTRLASKIAGTPINRLSDYWFDKCKEGVDERINTAIRVIHRKRKNGTHKARPQAHQ